MLFAFVYLVLQKCQGLSEEKGEPLFSTRISNILLLISVFSFMVKENNLVYLTVLKEIIHSNNLLEFCLLVHC
jgi:hypothetical protein